MVRKREQPRSIARTPPDGAAPVVGTGLKEALAEHARRLVELHGVEELTLRSVAKAADVSHNAPYIYFPGGVTELLAVVAIDGFQQLIAWIGHSPIAPDPLDRAREVVQRYVRFGVEHPHVYRVMFHARLKRSLESLDDSDLSSADAPETFTALRLLKVQAYEALVAPLVALQRDGALRPGNPRDFGLATAAMAHGLVGEFIDEGLGERVSRKQPWSRARRDMTTAVTDMLLNGLVAVSSGRRQRGNP